MGLISRSIIVRVAFLSVGLIVFCIETFTSYGSHSSSSPSALNSALKLSYLICFSTAWGTAIWVIFFGILMFKILPRHQLGNLRSKMFPVYYTRVSICGAISMAAFGCLHPWKSATLTEKYQLGFLSFAVFFNLTNLLVFTPMTLKVMKQRHKVERENHIGKEVGWEKNREVAKSNSKLAFMNNKFNKIHAFAALTHVLSFCCLAIHSWYLAGVIDL